MALGNYTAGIYLSYNEMRTNLETYVDITGKTYFIYWTQLRYPCEQYQSGEINMKNRSGHFDILCPYL